MSNEALTTRFKGLERKAENILAQSKDSPRIHGTTIGMFCEKLTEVHTEIESWIRDVEDSDDNSDFQRKVLHAKMIAKEIGERRALLNSKLG